jgi:hypothetical protein
MIYIILWVLIMLWLVILFNLEGIEVKIIYIAISVALLYTFAEYLFN